MWACVSLHCVFIVEQFVNLADQLDQSGEKSCGAGQSTNYRDASGVYDVFYTDQTGRCLLPCWLLAFLAEGGSIIFSLAPNLFFSQNIVNVELIYPHIIITSMDILPTLFLYISTLRGVVYVNITLHKMTEFAKFRVKFEFKRTTFWCAKR